MLERTPPQNALSEIVKTTRALLDAARCKDDDAFGREAARLCTNVSARRGSRYLIPSPIDNGLAVSTIVHHKPTRHPPTTKPREFDTLFFAAVVLMEVAGLRVTFQWRKDPAVRNVKEKGRYYLRGVISNAAGMRMYVTRIILNAAPGHSTQFNEDHHSYRLRDLIQRNGGGMLPDGQLGRRAAIDRCSESYAANCPEHHADLPPNDYRRLLTDVLSTATLVHGEGDLSNHALSPDHRQLSRQDSRHDPSFP